MRRGGSGRAQAPTIAVEIWELLADAACQGHRVGTRQHLVAPFALLRTDLDRHGRAAAPVGGRSDAGVKEAISDRQRGLVLGRAAVVQQSYWP